MRFNVTQRARSLHKGIRRWIQHCRQISAKSQGSGSRGTSRSSVWLSTLEEPCKVLLLWCYPARGFVQYNCAYGVSTASQKPGQVGDSIGVDGGGDRVVTVFSQMAVVFSQSPLDLATPAEVGFGFVHVSLEERPVACTGIRWTYGNEDSNHPHTYMWRQAMILLNACKAFT